MAEFYKTSTLWVIDFRYEGRRRRWFRAFRSDLDPRSEIANELNELYGRKVQLNEVRPASEEEESQYLRGEVPANVYCPTGR